MGTIQRYRFTNPTKDGCHYYLAGEADGEWVTYEDHVAALSTERQRAEKAEAAAKFHKNTSDCYRGELDESMKEVERLTKERDEAVDVLRRVLNVPTGTLAIGSTTDGLILVRYWLPPDLCAAAERIVEVAE